METITEDYISFEIAKILKEKWFKFIENRDELSKAYVYAYTKEGKEVWGCYSPDYYPCITINMAMKWLREVHKIHVTIYYSAFLYGTHPYYWSIDKMDSIPRANTQIKTSTSTHDYSFAHYEKCCESAIKYCLENLI